jgi:TP901 family phage tail tape measure protein
MSINLSVQGNTQPLEAAVQAAVNRIRKTPIKITVDDRGATQPLGNMKRGADEFSKSMEAANSRIIAFGASMAIINGVADGFKALVKNVVEVEKALADINVVMNLSTANLEKFSNGLFKTAKETGAAFNIAAEAATEYARQGLTMEESLKRTRDALILTRLTGMDSANAVKALTAAMNTYGDQIKDTTQLVSKFAAVDVKFAVSAEDFADAISRTGQAARSAGVDIDELVGLVTAAQQKTARGGKVIGNSFKTIFTRIGRTDTLNQLENLGIAVRDLEGNTIGARRILTDLANTFDHLTESQKAQIAQTVGGVFQINILKAVLSDAAKQNGILANATQISAGATTEAIDKNDQLRQTMSAMATETGLALKELSAQIGEIMLAPGMEKVLNVFKGLAEGANEMLGGGESTGSDFAQGFLKGLGNIITGPGLVIISAVFIKLFAKALVYANQSLRSLIGVTSEAHKQKAIQTSLVTLFGQNAAISKEMLRTDISRTEKEKIILGLLKAQVVEANMLNSVSKSVAASLYTKGYNASLAPRKGRSGGHIPNFADPERAQAARGGYAAGTIRSMNMPGEGSVIYNSAEKVKNFKGMSQPAIMPPHSSKAGKNYQQAFGDVHGFDPYAAGGYVPNYAGISGLKPTGSRMGDYRLLLTQGSQRKGQFQSKGKGFGSLEPEEANLALKRSRSKKTTASTTSQLKNTGLANTPLNLNQIPLTRSKINNMGVILGQGKEGLSYPTYSQPFSSLPKELRKKLMPYMKSIKGKEYGLDKMPTEGSDHWKRKVTATLPTKAVYAVSKDDAERMEKAAGADTLKAALKGSIGTGFDKFSSKIGQKLFGSKSEGTNVLEEHVLSDGSALGALFEAGVRGALNNKALTGAEQQRPFDFVGSNAIALSTHFMGLKKARDKIEAKKDFGAAKHGDIPKKVLNAAAGGYIPNFADPLSDAIGRETAAGVPVSQIRVGSHPALMGKSNPVGLGVTNTHDEPNGLKDVFGAANGFVPNYALNFSDNFNAGRDQYRAAAELQGDINKENKKLIKEKKELLIQQKQGKNVARKLVDVEKKYIQNKSDLSLATKMASDATKQMGKVSRLGGMTQKVSNMADSFNKSAPGRMLGSTGGQMGLMMGLPMAAGFMGDAATNVFGEKAGAATSGALSGAGSGAAMGMMFGPLGTAIGATVGGLYGLVDGLNEAEEAAVASKKAHSEYSKTIGTQLGSLIFSDRTGRMNFQKELPSLQKKIKNADAETSASTKVINKAPIASAWGGYGGTGGPRVVETSKGAKAAAQRTKGKAMLDVRKAIGDTLLSISPDRKISMKEILTEEELKKGKQAESKEYTGAQYLEEINKKVKGDDQLLVIFNQMVDSFGKSNKVAQDQAKAVIVQLDIQKAQIAAQQSAAMSQLIIKDKYSKIADKLNFQDKLMGNLMSDQQKAMTKYKKAMAGASEKFASAKTGADSSLKSGLISQVGNDENIQALIKKNMANLNEGSNIQDITKEINKLSGEELDKKLREIASQDDTSKSMREAINKALSTETDKRKNIIALADKEKIISEGKIKRERRLNSLLADRSQALKNLQRENRMESEEVRSSQKIRGFTDEVAAAKRLNVVGPGYQTGREKEEFAMSEKAYALQSKIKALRENEDTNLKKLGEDKLKIQDPSKKAKQRIAKISAIPESERSEGQVKFFEKTVELLQERQIQLDEIEAKIKNIGTETKKEIGSAEKLLELEKERLAAKRKHETGPGAFGRGARDAQKRIVEQAETMEHRLGDQLTHQFRDGLVDGMQAAINKADDLSDVMNNIAMNFLGAIQQAYLGKAADAIVGALPFSSGGGVRKYSKGGGVPAMVTDGEYVMGRDAVKKYGGGFMHRLNAGGKLPGYSNGGKPDEPQPGSALASNFGGGEGYNTGRRYQSQAMSGFFYSGQSGNLGLQEDTQYTKGIIQERMRKEAEKKAKKRALMQMIVGTALSVGIGSLASAAIGGGGLTADAKADGYTNATPAGVKSATQGSMKYSLLPGADATGFDNVQSTRSFNPFKVFGSGSSVNDRQFGSNNYDYGSPLAEEFSSAYRTAYRGGKINGYANGGHISGKSGIDQIPAMLSEGEYVVRASSARQLGKPMLDRINAGKFNDGGAVTPLTESSETGTSGGNTNNINITVNMDKGSGKSEKKDDKGGANPKDSSADQEKSSQLAEKVKQQVISVIMDEKRPGGLLSD